jgi:hypothetical protein
MPAEMPDAEALHRRRQHGVAKQDRGRAREAAEHRGPMTKDREMQDETQILRGASLERRLVELAWTDPVFAELLQRDSRQALGTLGAKITPGVEVDVRLQRRDTLCFVIPPLAAEPNATPTPINQMDLWQGGGLFCWILPQALKLELLRMRQIFRRAHP